MRYRCMSKTHEMRWWLMRSLKAYEKILSATPCSEIRQRACSGSSAEIDVNVYQQTFKQKVRTQHSAKRKWRKGYALTAATTACSDPQSITRTFVGRPRCLRQVGVPRKNRPRLRPPPVCLVHVSSGTRTWHGKMFVATVLVGKPSREGSPQ